ncbi:unnamed protein product, partial [Darwinula stevensoni]
MCLLFSVACLLSYFQSEDFFHLDRVIRLTLNYNQEIRSKEDVTIWFVMTSDDPVLNPRQSCAIESTSQMNPFSEILVFHTRPDIEMKVNLPNVKFQYLGPQSMFAGSPLDSWYHSQAFNESPYKRIHLSDGLRTALLWEYGGIYMDLDFICLKPLRDLTRNFLGFEGEKRVNVMKYMTMHYNPDSIPGAGPNILSDVFLKHCPEDNSTDWSGTVTCDGVTAYPKHYFYPVPYEQNQKLFSRDHLEEVLKELDGSHAIHFWNALTNGIQANVKDEVVLTVLARKYCPSVANIAGESFRK